MNAPQLVAIDVRHLVFPVIAGRQIGEGFDRTGLAGTGFFIGGRGLALTARHVVSNLAQGYEVRAALPTSEGPMRAYRILWHQALPGTDIAVLRVDMQATRCFATRFERLPLGHDVQTTAIPESMLDTDAVGRTRILMRCVKGYVSHGEGGWIAASFSLPKGMSGAPLIAKTEQEQFVAGVFVGQTRGEQIEDQVEEVIDERRVQVSKVAKVEYFARGELLEPHLNFTAQPFEGYTLRELVERDLCP